MCVEGMIVTVHACGSLKTTLWSRFSTFAFMLDQGIKFRLLGLHGKHTHVYTHTRMYTTHTRTNAFAHIHAHTHICTHTHTYTCICTYTHTCTHIQTSIHMHRERHTQIKKYRLCTRKHCRLFPSRYILLVHWTCGLTGTVCCILCAKHVP